MKLFYKLYQEVANNKNISRTQQIILTLLINRAEYHNNQAFYCYEKWIASEIGCSEKTVKRAIKTFAEQGYISIDRVYNKTLKKKINFYTLNIDTISNAPVTETTDIVSGVYQELDNTIVTNTKPTETIEDKREFDWDSITGNDFAQLTTSIPEPVVDDIDYDALEAEWENSAEYQEYLKMDAEYAATHNEYDEPIENTITEPISIVNEPEPIQEIITNDSDIIKEWRSECNKHIKTRLENIVNGICDEVGKKICDRKLQPTYDKCIANGISSEELLMIKKNITTQVKLSIEKEYDRKLLLSA